LLGPNLLLGLLQHEDLARGLIGACLGVVADSVFIEIRSDCELCVGAKAKQVKSSCRYLLGLLSRFLRR
jgi:hypothetical protein